MKVTFNSKELTAVEGYLITIGLELNTLKAIIDTDTAEYSISDLKISENLSESRIEKINREYGAIVTLTSSEDTYVITVNEDFVADYLELCGSIFGEFTKAIIGLVKSLKFAITPLVEKFANKWYNLL